MFGLFTARRAHTTRAILIFLSVCLAAATFFCLSDPSALRTIVMTIFSFMIADRFGDIFTANLDDQDRNKLDDLITTLPVRMAGSHDVIRFANNADAAEYCRQLAGSATYIRNTVLRYDADAEPVMPKETYAKWVAAKKEALKRAQVDEIVSKHLRADDLVHEMIKAKPARYKPKAMDDIATPMMQMAIFILPSFKAVVFGWMYPRLDDGPCFASQNEQFVNAFIRYFDHHFEHVAKPI